ncbi:phytoene desaturase family protein [Cohnella abietis]|uniref:Phytoene desaturase n=1 Tax=Cohnella abietis TaxID=2507935 RepID=A0A3T1D6C2_9BACL|nr:phytoene desaturase family protein [Cohnella abietis]BBI33630.1 phytoene desaturase [Cohnella abietis]
MKKRKVAIVGAGPGGLAAAMLLSAQDYTVEVFEKQASLGGRTSRVELGDYRFDRGPTFFLMPSLLEELFNSVGRSLHDYVQLIELDPLYRLQFGETQFSPSRDSKRTKEQIDRLFPGDGDGYLRFMEEEGKKFEKVSPLLRRSFSSPKDYLKKDLLSALPRLNAVGSVYDRLSRYFKDERLKYAFSFQAKYLGMSPWDCPGTFTILSYLEHKYGLYHPIGGVNRICKAMGSVISEFGGEIRLSAGVKKVITSNGRAIGLMLDDGEKVEADHVILNADFATAMNELFEPGILRKYRPEKLARKKYSCSTYMLYMGINRKIELPHHTVLFANDYRRNVQQMMSGERVSEDPSIYIHNPGVTDSTLAPEGKTALYALMPVANLTGKTDWVNEESRIRETMLKRMEQLPELKGISGQIEVEASLTPLGWRDNHGVYRGATFNLAHSLDQMMMLRPHNRFEEVDNCWLVGGGTHPGSGLPTIFESARISTSLLIEQDARQKLYAASIPSSVPSGKGAFRWK